MSTAVTFVMYVGIQIQKLDRNTSHFISMCGSPVYIIRHNHIFELRHCIQSAVSLNFR